MKNKIKKFICYLSILVLVFGGYFQSDLLRAKAESDDTTSQEISIEDNHEDPDVGGDGSALGADTAPPSINMPSSLILINNFFRKSFDTTKPQSTTDGFLWAAENILQNPKLVLNPADLKDLRILACLGDVIPDFANNDESLSAASGKMVEEIMMLKIEHPDEWRKLIESAQEGARKDIVSRLKTDVKNFACIAGVDETMAADMMKYDVESVDAIIDYAQNKVVIDRRVLLMLVNLVTPKNAGGAGHERIKVLRIRNSYDRDSKMYSRESEAIQAEIDKKKNAELQTVADVSSASRDQLSANREFAGSDAQASLIDSAGNSEGDLLFNTTESDVNLSAHAKGEAVDISEVDNMRCTLIKKKRLGKDKKIAQPATPIKIAWQTTDGYDNSPPADYSSLSMNLRQAASGQYIEMLDELGINPDGEEDLSDASFGDIASLIGESLLAEILNSPTNSLKGYSLSDTVKTIGGMILADKLSLPRQPFIEADLTNLSDLETKIGEAALEKKLNLYYGSIRGANLDETLRNVGLRHLEKQLDIPQNTITAGIGGAEMKIEIGRRLIEEELRLTKGSFKNDTNYKKLLDIAGKRKIELLFTNPSEIDEALGIELHFSQDYQNNSISADGFASVVGAKLLTDRAYIFGNTSASASALNLAPVSNAGSQTLPTVDYDETTSRSSEALLTSTGIAKARFTSIMTGTFDPIGTGSIDFNDMYKTIGVEVLASGLTSNSESRLGLVSWLKANSVPNSGECPLTNLIKVTIPKPGRAVGSTDTIEVTIPEDQMMASYGLRRGDLARLFGCYNSSTGPIFKGLGEKALLDAVKNSTLAQQARAKFLADHPEISSFLADIEFYRTRVDSIKISIDKIKNDWGSASSGNADLQALIAQINTAAISVAATVGSIDSTADAGTAVRSIRNIPVLVDGILTTLTTIQNGSDESLRNRANGTLGDITSVVHSVDEILAGEAQPGLDTLQIGDINVNGNGNSARSSSGAVTDQKGGTLNRATLVLMLSGKLKPKDYLISVGSNLIEDSLNLPTNGILYFAKYLESPSKDNDDMKNAFFRAIGQAQVEETFGMPAFFFQGGDPAKKATLSDVKIHVADSFKISQTEAGARIMQALNLPGEFSTIERGSSSSISSSVLAAKSIDGKLGLSDGTTTKFLAGETLNSESLGNSEIRMLAGALSVPEEAINTFMAVKRGEESIEDARKNTLNSLISYNNHNEFADKPAATNTGSPVDDCPFDFRINPSTGKLTSSFFEDNSYVYATRDGAVSFPNLAEAKSYAASTPETKKVDFTQAMSIGILKAKGAATPSTDEINQINTQLTNFVKDKNQPEAFPDTDLVAMADMMGVPPDTIRVAFDRKEIKEKQIAAKPINSYLELVGKKTAERRIVSSLLGGMSMTFGGLRVDATDIFDVLNGNSKQVLFRIGSRYIEDQLNIPQSTIMKILESPNQVLKNCSLSKIGGNILGSALGVGSVSLSGNIYDNIGGAKIEQVLGLPERSFRGSNVNGLIDNMGAAKFAQVFYLPPDIVTPSSVVNTLLDSPGAANLSLQSYDDRAARIDNLVGDVGSFSYVTPDILNTAETSINTLVKQFVHDPASYAATTRTDNRSLQIVRFQQRIRQLDPLIGFDTGTTEKMLKDVAGNTPDDLIEKAAGKVLLASADTILAAFGLDEDTKGIVSTVVNLSTTLEIIKACGRPTSSGAKCDASGKLFLYQNLQQLLGINFDVKLGLPNGTMSAIIADPQQAVARLIDSAIGKFDESLGLDKNSDASFSFAFSLFWRSRYGGSPGYTYAACSDPNSSACQNLKNLSDSDTMGLSGYGYYTTTVNKWEYVGKRIALQLAGNYLSNAGIISTGRPSSGPYLGFSDTAELIHESANMLIHGDLRILAITGGVKAAEALHLYNDSTTPNMPRQYRITFEDIYYSVMGDPVMENEYVSAATTSFIHDWETEQTSTPAQDTDVTGSVVSYQYGSQCPPGVMRPDCHFVSSNPEDPIPDTAEYNTYGSMESMQVQFAAENAPPDGYTPSTAIEEQNTRSLNAMADLQRAQEHARSQARQDLRNNLMWRMADAKMFQIDPNVPAGFARTMFKGTGAQRTTMLLNFAKNTLRSLSIGGVTLGDLEDMRDIVNQIRSFINNPAGFDLDSLVKNGDLTKFDTWISGKFGDFFGFDLQPGTFTALFYGFKKGNFNTDTVVNINGQDKTFSSLKNIYTDWAVGKVTGWADKALGLPSGTIYTSYKMYKGIQSARSAMAAAKTTQEVAAAKGKIVELKAELISFIITTLFAKQIGAAEQALGLVPGTGAMLVSSAVSYIMTGAIPWIGLAMFVVMNLFGVYKVVMVCTADGYYPGYGGTSGTPKDPSKYDVAGLGEFDGMNSNSRKSGYIDAARYKARTLAGDALMLAERTGDETAIPSQIMVGRQEDVDYWQYKTDEVICSKIGGCEGSRAGMWYNPQTTGYTHIGF